MGGPIKKDKAFFFGSVQRYSAEYDPSGPLQNADGDQPAVQRQGRRCSRRSIDTITLGMQYDQYNVTGRVGYWPTAQATDSATVEEDAPEWVWNAQYRKVFGAEHAARGEVHRLHRLLLPRSGRSRRRRPMTAATDAYGGGGGGLYYADRSRNQVNVALTKYAEKFGRHSFKFGAEIERSHVRSQYQPYGPAGFYIYQYGGVPYYQVQLRLRPAGRQPPDVGLRAGPVDRRAADAEPRRSPGPHPRLQPGARRRTSTSRTTAWGPRLGAAYDLTGKGTTVLKGFWGRYFEGPATGFFYQAAPPGIQDYVWTPVLLRRRTGTLDRRPGGLTPPSSTGSATTSAIRAPTSSTSPASSS